MNQFILTVVAGALLLSLEVGAQTNSNVNGQNPYMVPSGSDYQSSGAYQPSAAYQLQKPNHSVDRDYPVANPSSQGEESFMQNAQRRYEWETQQNQNMIERDRMMMQREYDPNQSFNYNQREQYKSQPGQQPSSIAYPRNNPGTSKEVLDNAEARLRGGYSNQEPQYVPEHFSNPYENQQRNTNSGTGRNY